MTSKRKPKLTRRRVPQAAERLTVRDNLAPPPQPEREHIANAPATAEEVLDSLIQSRAISAPFDRLLALRIVNAAISGKISDVPKLLDHLPPRVTADTSARTVSATDAKEKLLELVLNQISADEVEQQIEEQREVDRLRLENAELRRRLGEPVETIASTPEGGKVIVPRDGDIVGPREQSDNPQNARPAPGPDDAKYKPGQNTVIDATATPVEPASPTGANWDASANAALWRAWRDSNGGYGGGGVL
jgi:hypothetical protein